MSGICAIVNFDGAPVDEAVLRAMAEACAYRGPDGIRYWLDGNVGLAHLAMYSTPEAEREHQPLHSADGQLYLVADARVDNRPELIHLLAAKDFLEQDDPTDADLILAAYRCWGENCPEQIIGDFAFAIWDAAKQRLFCARDALGIKTLHYAQVGATLCVATEAQQILRHPLVPHRLDELSVGEYLVANFWDEERSMFQDVHRLPMANSLSAEKSSFQINRYWDIDPELRLYYKRDAEYSEHFLELFQRSISDRLRTPSLTVGITMSGGLDSTSIAGVAQQILSGQNDIPHLLACSYVFDQLKDCDEREYSGKMVSDLGIDLIYINGEEFWFLDDDEAYTPSLETPFMANETRTRHILNIFKERNAGVWLTGHGGDNLLTGSPKVCADRLQRWDLVSLWNIARFWRTRRLPLVNLYNVYRDWFIKPLVEPALRRIIHRPKQVALKPVIQNWLTEDFVSRTHLKEQLSSIPPRPYFSDRAREANYASIIQLTSLLPTIHWADRRAAEFHMEARHPFLDRRLASFILSIPQDQTFHDGTRKYILRQAMKGILPENIRSRQTKTIFNSEVAIGLKFKEVNKVMTLFTLLHPFLYDIIFESKIKYSYQCYIDGTNEPGIQEIWKAISLILWIKSNQKFLDESF